MAPIVQRYISPKERAENRARIRAWLYWTAVTIPALIALIMFGYSDQAPEWLRGFTVSLDATFGFPVLWLIKLVAAP
jgi:glutathione S-transferase